MDLWSVYIARKSGIEASDEEIEFSRICVYLYVGRRTTRVSGRRVFSPPHEQTRQHTRLPDRKLDGGSGEYRHRFARS